MNIQELRQASPTAQVRMLAEAFLSDKEKHPRKQIEEYVVSEGRKLGLEPFRNGHIAGGIREATINMECIKLDRAVYQATISKSQETVEEEKRVDEMAADVCKNAWEEISAIARQIDFVNADEAQMAQLMRLKACVQKLRILEQEMRENK